MDTTAQSKPVNPQQFYTTIGIVYMWLGLLALETAAEWWHMIASCGLLVMALLYIGAGWRAVRRPA